MPLSLTRGHRTMGTTPSVTSTQKSWSATASASRRTALSLAAGSLSVR